jgi:heterodisulfide reductase subunit B
MKYALFVGCTTLARLPGYEKSARNVATKLGVELVDMSGSSCCGTTYLETLDHKTGLAIAARNIAIAEEMGMDIVTVCNGCTEVLTKANKELKEDPELKEEVNKVLAEAGKEFNGTASVKHYVRMLRDDVGLETIKENMEKDLGDIKVGSHYGCHMLKPSDIMETDDPENPTLLDDLVSTTGAKPIDYLNKLECCAGPIMGVRENVTWSVGQDKVNEIKKTGDMMVTACPFCYLTYERAQLMNEDGENLPVLHLPQVLGLGLGLDNDELGIGHNNIDASNILEKVN